MSAVGTEPTLAGGGQLGWKNSARLADGREIIYSDESPGLNRALARDTREGLAPVPAPGAWSPESPEQAVRWDPPLGEWVVTATQRQDRTFAPPPDQCPLDPSAPGRPTEIPADSYDVVVFENRFPSLRGASALPGTEAAGCPIWPPWTTRPARRFGGLYLDVLRRFDRLFDTPAPCIAAWHQAPVTDSVARAEFGLHLQVFTVRRAPGKLKYLAGTESGMGGWGNDIVPETAAQGLREAG